VESGLEPWKEHGGQILRIRPLEKTAKSCTLEGPVFRVQESGPIVYAAEYMRPTQAFPANTMPARFTFYLIWLGPGCTKEIDRRKLETANYPTTEVWQRVAIQIDEKPSSAECARAVLVIGAEPRELLLGNVEMVAY
jgi:hypothetical protein